MREIRETKCVDCGDPVVATSDDPAPRCEKCQFALTLSSMHRAIMAGEFDHIDLDDWIAMMEVPE